MIKGANMRRFTMLVIGVLTLGVLLVPSLARADFAGGVVTVSATAGDLTGSAQFAVPAFSGDAAIPLVADPVEIKSDDGTVLGVVKQLDLAVAGDPAVDLAFNVVAGGVPTAFGIVSVWVPAPVPIGWGYASAGVTLTDLDNNGAVIVPILAAHPKLYQAAYTAPLTTFADLVGGFVAGVGQTAVSNDRKPPGVGWLPVAGVVSIASRFDFVLSANDSASGTSHFEVTQVPLPAAAFSGLALLGVIAGYRARRLFKA